MLGHLFKLVWKRKARNLMLSLEIMLAFILVFAIAAVGVRYLQIYRLPTGFEHQGVWSVTLLPPIDEKTTFTPELYSQFKNTLEALTEVEQVAFANISPFSMSGMRGDFHVPGSGRTFSANMLEVNDDFFAVLGMQAVRGRFFDSKDDGAPVQSVVINKRLAGELFGTDAAEGKTFEAAGKRGADPARFQVSAVVDDLRFAGELSSPRNVIVMRHIPFQTSMSMQTVLIKMAPGTPRAFEEQLSRQLKQARSDWGYEIAPVSSLRSDALANMLTPLKVAAVIAVFLLAMVAVGLFGVLWQNTARRIPEIGLRRAVGASAGDIYRQIIAEQMLLSSGAIAAGLLLLVQFPITEVLGEELNWTVFVVAAAISMALIYLLSLLCSVYPGWRASRLSPTEALHFE